ncbi:MAG: putative NBD/HSP70 family sugar kinase, partial [bacterium]
MFIYPQAKQNASAQGADGSQVRHHNSGLLLRMVWDDETGLSRADLARGSGLSRSTVSAIVADLVDAGLVVESHIERHRSGRPPMVLQFNDQRQLIAGVEIGCSHVSAVLTDLRGRVLGTRRSDVAVQVDPTSTLARVVQDIRSLCQAANVSVDSLLGVGVGVPCPLDQSEPNRLSERILPAWNGTNVGRELYMELGVPLFISNDANLGALAEAWWGAGIDQQSIVFVKVATGVGAGIVVDGEVFSGSSGMAGEIGHTTVDPNGRLCRCGLSGCLEAEVGSQAIVDRVREAIAAGQPSCLSRVSNPSLSDVVAAARRQDSVALQVIDDVGKYLGIAIANLLNLLNPSRVIMGGRLTEAG